MASTLQNMVRQNYKVIVIKDAIYNELKKRGQAGDSFNDVITKVIKEYEEKILHKR